MRRPGEAHSGHPVQPPVTQDERELALTALLATDGVSAEPSRPKPYFAAIRLLTRECGWDRCRAKHVVSVVVGPIRGDDRP